MLEDTKTAILFTNPDYIGDPEHFASVSDRLQESAQAHLDSLETKRYQESTQLVNLLHHFTLDNYILYLKKWGPFFERSLPEKDGETVSALNKQILSGVDVIHSSSTYLKELLSDRLELLENPSEKCEALSNLLKDFNQDNYREYARKYGPQFANNFVRTDTLKLQELDNKIKAYRTIQEEFAAETDKKDKEISNEEHPNANFTIKSVVEGEGEAHRTTKLRSRTNI